MPAPRVLARAAGFAVVAALLLSAPVSAAVPSSLTATGHGMVATVSGLKLVSNAAVSVQISYTCDPIDENGTLVSAVFGGGSVTVSQAVGKTIAKGTITFGGPATCDSSTVNHQSALVISETVPFTTGASVIQTSIQASDDNFCCQGDYFRRATVQGAIKIAAGATTAPSTLTTTGHGMTFTVAGVKLVTRAAVNVDMSFTCDPIDENGTLVSALIVDEADITMTEAVGTSIARGTGIFNGPVTCDSATVNHFSTLIVSATVPFKTGVGVIAAGAQAFDPNFCCGGDFFRSAFLVNAIKIVR